LAVVVTVAKGYDLGYIWKTQGETAAGRYINAAQAGEPPGRWWGPAARSLAWRWSSAASPDGAWPRPKSDARRFGSSC